MTPSLFDLPIRAPEAAALATLVFEQAGEKPMTDDIRNRIAGRSALLALGSIKPYFASLERDPIHPSAVYLAIDGLEGQPLLLRMAPAGTPSSGLFPKAILIGRMPGPKGIEMVINASPYDDTIQVFAEKVNRAFLPRPQGIHSAIVVRTAAPRAVLPAAFEFFRTILKSRGLNLAGVENIRDGIWAAIRTGWREGYISDAKEAIPAAQLTSRVRAICILSLDDPSEVPERLEQCSQFLS
jgi:hypothetical protein